MSTGPQVRSSLRVAVISGLYRAASSPNVRLPHAEIKEVVVFLSEPIAVPGHGLAVCVSVSVERQSRACRTIASGLKAYHSAIFLAVTQVRHRSTVHGLEISWSHFE